MRRLLYIPIIHDEVDMGSAGASLSHRSAGVAGIRRWAQHQQFVRRFWDGIGSYLGRLDARRVRVYQDGLPADSETGRRIVEKAAAMGSTNYQLVRELLRWGAELRKTEDATLLLQEREVVLRNVQSASRGDDSITEQTRFQKRLLMERRDEFIAQAINRTLREGELGVLFIGASHNVVPLLAPDISVHAVIEPGLVTAYFEELLGGQDDLELERLASRLLTTWRDVS